MPDLVPVAVITGFLGSGKTTLLRGLLRSPGFARTAVIVNEFGEIGLDHALIETSDESLVQLTTGCLCCAIRGDLTRTLLDLAARRSAGTARFDRVVIETSGLADPAPILHALMADALVASIYALHQVVTIVDAVHGGATLDAQVEARRQVAVADRVLFSKTDLADPGALRDRVAALNPSAAIGATTAPDIAERVLQAAAPRDRPWMAWLSPPAFAPQHTDGIGTALVLRDRPLPGAALALFLPALTAHAGARLLRVKGLVDIEEMPGRPALIHGVQHVFSPPEWLDRWPSTDRRTRIVLIGRGIPPHWPTRLLDAIEEEVRAEAAARQGGVGGGGG